MVVVVSFGNESGFERQAEMFSEGVVTVEEDRA